MHQLGDVIQHPDLSLKLAFNGTLFKRVDTDGGFNDSGYAVNLSSVY